MKAVRCNNGHYYDADKYRACPFCSNGSAVEDEGRTVSYDEDADTEVTKAFSASPTGPSGTKPEVSVPVVGWVVCVKGAERGRDYRLQAGRNFVGRSLDMDVCIREDGAVTRDNHCSIVYDPRSGRFVLLPGEASETKINGEPLNGIHDLNDGDVIECGETSLCFIGFCREGRTW